MAVSEARADDGKLWVYVGTYTKPGGSKGIYRAEFDATTGKLTEPVLAGETTNPSFLALHPSRRYLYAVGEISDFGGKKTGAVNAFAIDPKTGDLKLLNQQPSGGAGPCHLVVDKAGKNVLVANYGGGSASALSIKDDGKLGEATWTAQHKGKSVNPRRQEAPHAHSINLDAANRFAFVADLGLDQVIAYRLDPDKGTLEGGHPAFETAPGAGPRHFAFHPSGKFAYVINELANTIDALSYDGKNGMFNLLESVPALPKDFKGTSYTAEVQVHPSGKFVYGSNRGHDSIVAYAVDPTTGRLTYVGHQGSGIKTPRNFGIDPTGKYLLVANQDSNSLVVFKIDASTGQLTPTGTKVDVPMPVCVKFMPAGH